MQRCKQIFLIALLLGISSTAHADGNANVMTAVMFPPDATSCVAGDMNVIAWDGQHNVRCAHVPKCGGLQILKYDGTSFSCYPSKTDPGVPTAQFPPNLNVVNVTPMPDPQTVPQMPAGVTPVSASSSDPTLAQGITVGGQ